MTVQVDAHAQTEHEKHRPQHAGGSGQERGGPAGTEDSCRSTAAEARSCIGARAVLQEDQHDHRRSDQDVKHAENDEHKVSY